MSAVMELIIGYLRYRLVRWVGVCLWMGFSRIFRKKLSLVRVSAGLVRVLVTTAHLVTGGWNLMRRVNVYLRKVLRPKLWSQSQQWL